MSLQLNPVLFPHISVFVTHTENKGRKGGKRFYSIHFCVHFIIKTSILGPGCSHWLKRWLYRWHVLFIVDNISWYDIQIHLWDMRHKFKRSMCASNRVVRKLWEAISGGSGNKVPFISAIDKLCDSLLERLDQRETLLVESAEQMINIRSDLVRRHEMWTSNVRGGSELQFPKCILARNIQSPSDGWSWLQQLSAERDFGLTRLSFSAPHVWVQLVNPLSCRQLTSDQSISGNVDSCQLQTMTVTF